MRQQYKNLLDEIAAAELRRQKASKVLQAADVDITKAVSQIPLDEQHFRGLVSVFTRACDEYTKALKAIEQIGGQLNSL